MRPPTTRRPAHRVAAHRAEAGQSTPLVAAACVLAALVVLALVARGGDAVDAARARTAADAAALAGAADGPAAADRLARANGGRLVSVHASGGEVEVTVVVGGAEATARARREGSWCRTWSRDRADIPYTRAPCPSTPG